MLPENEILPSTADAPLLLRVEEAAQRLAVSHSTAKWLVATGLLPSVRIGTARRITATALENFVGDLAAGRVMAVPRPTGRPKTADGIGPSRAGA